MSRIHSSTSPINILHALEQVEVTCDKPSYDGFDAANLLHINGKGFMAERFIKPPVTLTVKFPCSVRIKAIIIQNTVGSFSSSGFEILSYSLADGQSPCKTPVYKPIGRCFDVKPGQITFINKRYRVDSEWVFPEAEQSYVLVSHDSTLLNSARFLAIRITRTLNGGIPVLKDLKIFGYPVTAGFLRLPKQPHQAQPKPDSGNEIFTTNVNTKVVDKTDTTPQEFLDPLTCDMMTLPLILPSGYTVDQLTFDKHIEAEKSRGRKPSDPFTGVPLSQCNPPIVHHLLKERIDRYILTKGLDDVGRTSGRKRSHVPSHEVVKICNEPPTKRETKDSNVSAGSSLVGSHQLGEQSSSTNPTSKLLSSRLTKVLAKSAMFRTVQIPVVRTVICHQCSTDGSLQTLYQLSCKHLLCRDCLLTTGDEISCTKCTTVSSKSCITRYHYK